MSKHVRWKEPGSEVEPALREVMRHAQRQGPDAAQLSALTERVLAQLPASTPASVPPEVATEAVQKGAGRGLKPAALGHSWDEATGLHDVVAW